jgi:hypothetical protein
MGMPPGLDTPPWVYGLAFLLMGEYAIRSSCKPSDVRFSFLREPFYHYLPVSCEACVDEASDRIPVSGVLFLHSP